MNTQSAPRQFSKQSRIVWFKESMTKCIKMIRKSLSLSSGESRKELLKRLDNSSIIFDRAIAKKMIIV